MSRQDLAINIILSAVDEASKDLDHVNAKVKQLREELDRSEFTRSAGGLERFGAAVKSATQPMADAAKTGLAFAGAMTAVTAALAGKVYQAAVSYESALLDLAKVLEGGREQAEQYGEQLNALADQYAQNGQELVGAMANFVQAGYKADEAFRLVEQSTKLMISGDIEATEAAKNLVSILKGFDAPASEAAHAVDLLNEVSNAYATDVKQLSEGMAALSPVAKQMGFTLDETAGLLTPIIEVYQSGAEAADALKVGLLKLTDDAKPVREALAQIGVAQRDANGQLRAGKDIFLDVARAFETLSDTEKLDLTARLVGLEQAGRMSTVLGNLNKVLAVTETASKAAGSAMKEVATRLQSAEAQIDRANERFRQLSVTLGNQFKTEISGVVAATGELAKAFDDSVKGGALDPLLAALRPQVSAIETLFRAMAENLDEALNGLDWSPLVEALGDLSGEFGEAFRVLTDGMDLSTADGLHALFQSLINVMGDFTRYLAGVVDGLGPLFSSLNTMFGLVSQGYPTIARLIGEMQGLSLSANQVVPALSALGSAVFGAVGQVVELTVKIGLLVAALRLLSGLGALPVLGSLLGVIGRLNPALAGAIAALTGMSGAVGVVAAGTTGLSFGLGLLLNKLLNVANDALEAKTGLDLLATAEERAQKAADESAKRRADKLREISTQTGVTVTNMKELEAAVKSGALVQDAATGAWSRGNAELKQREAEVKANAAASQLLTDRAAEETARTQALTDTYRAQGLEYDARTGAVTRATAASEAMGQALTWEQQLAQDGVTVLQYRNGVLREVSATTEAAAVSQARLSEAIQKAAGTDAETYATKLGQIRASQSELINLADAEAVRRRTLAQELGGDLGRIEDEIAENKKRVLTRIQSEYQAHIASLNATARSHLDEVRRIEDEIAALNLSTEERLRALQQQGMSDYERYQDQQSQIAEKGAAARQALTEGEFQKAADLYEEQAAIAERAARAVSNGDQEVISQQKAVEAAVAQVSEAMAGKEQALQSLAESHQARADAATTAIEQTKAAAEGVAEQIAALEGRDTASAHTVTTNADAALSEIQSLDGQDTSSTHTIYVKKVETNAAGGLVGLAQHFASGGAVPGFPVPRWSTVPGVGNTDSVPAALAPGSYVLKKHAARYYGTSLLDLISRFAAGGHVPSLLMPGERLFQPGTVSRLGPGFFDALNQMRLPREQILAALGAMSAPVTRFAAGGSVGQTAAPMAPGGRESIDINLQIGQRQIRVQGSREQAQALAGALRELSRSL